MRRSFTVLSPLILFHLVGIAAMAQEDKLQGRWEGTARGFQGERPTVVTFKREDSGAYTGTITGLQGPISFKEIKLDGDQISTYAEVDSPQSGRLVINYKFALQGENMKGDGSVEVEGQTFKFTYELKRVSMVPTVDQRPLRTSVPQPQQKQSLDYFVGQWTFKWLGRESALGPGGSREGTTTFKLAAGGQSLERSTDGKSEEGAYQESAVIGFDETTKMLSFAERVGKLKITSQGDWSSPVSIRFKVDPIKINRQTLQLKRTIAIISASSFTVTEELSEDGGPFVRLGQGVFSKVNSTTKN